MNVPFQNGPTLGNDVFVPIDFIIGGKKWQEKVGRCLLNVYQWEGLLHSSTATGGGQVKSKDMQLGLMPS